MLNFILIFVGKILSKLIQIFNLGNGSTWPGHIALAVNKKFIGEMLSRSSLRIILIAGTNGKTTTARIIRTALEENGLQVIHNESGANLLNGIASTLIQYCTLADGFKQDFAIFEVDENALPHALDELTADYVVLLNLFRDQLDRYGEVRTISRKWGEAIKRITEKTKLILNADDPEIAYLAKATKSKAFFFGFNDLNHKSKTLTHAVDSIYCPNCGNKLAYKNVAYSHLGDWSCKKCGIKSPKADLTSFSNYPLPGDYNIYNVHAAVLLLRQIGLSDKEIVESFGGFTPAFGRQEIIEYEGKKVQIFLSKNPTSFNQSYVSIKNMGAKNILVVLNDRVPDGRDVSWIWDVDLLGMEKFKNILIAGDRAYDFALRVKYEMEDQGSKIPSSLKLRRAGKDQNQNPKLKTYEVLRTAIDEGVGQIAGKETLYVLPTYSAMLEVRKILTGREIL